MKTTINIQNVRNWIKEVFETHKINLRIHKDFPKYRLIEIMLPYIDLYSKSQYYMNINKSDRAYRTLHYKLHKFKAFNPNFGRQKIEIKKIYNAKTNKYSKEKIVSFNDNYPRFEEPDTFSFLKNHSDIIYDIRIREPILPSTPILNTDSSEEEEEEEAELLFDEMEEETEEETEIEENKKFGRNIDTIIFEDFKTRKLQKKIYNIFKNREKDIVDKSNDDKINKYLNEMKKSIDKSILRDDKLNDILK